MVVADVMRWPEWLPTVTSIEPLGSEELAIGASYRIAQPRIRLAVWTVVALEPFREFSWESRSAGVRALGKHVLYPESDQSTQASLAVEFSGPFSALASMIAGRLTQEYVNREAAALKKRVESGHVDLEAEFYKKPF